MEQQKAFKGELYLAIFYKTAAVLSSGYLLVEIGKLLTGNLETLSSHPELLAGLCLVSGFALVNLCRNRSPVFWKLIDLVWISTFAVTMVATVSLYFQEQSRADYRDKLARSIMQHQLYLPIWIEFVQSRCTGTIEHSISPCNLVQEHLHWAKEFSQSTTHLAAFVEGQRDWLLPGTGAYVMGPSYDSRIYFGGNRTELRRDDMAGLLRQLHEIATEYGLVEATEREISFNPDSDYLDKLFQELNNKKLRIMSERLSAGDETSNLPERLMLGVQVADIGYSVRKSAKMVQELKDLFDEQIAGQINNLNFAALFVACFVFPFRVGKSIYDIKVEKEKQNAPVLS